MAEAMDHANCEAAAGPAVGATRAALAAAPEADVRNLWGAAVMAGNGGACASVVARVSVNQQVRFGCRPSTRCRPPPWKPGVKRCRLRNADFLYSLREVEVVASTCCATSGFGAVASAAPADPPRLGASDAASASDGTEPVDAFLRRYGGRLLGGMRAEDGPGTSRDQAADAFDHTASAEEKHNPQLAFPLLEVPASQFPDSQRLSWLLMRNCILVGLTAGLQGWDHGAASFALSNLIEFKGLAHQPHFGPIMEGWILASAWVSNIVGNLLGYHAPSPKIGLLVAALLQAVGSGLTGAAPTLPVLIAGRLINGLGLGLTGVAVGQYTSEVAPPGVRGGAISCQETTFVFGAVMGAIVGRHWLRQPGGWRRIWGLASVVATLAFASTTMMPDTPRSVYKRAANAAAAERQHQRNGNEPADAAPEARLQAREAARQEALQAMCHFRGLAAPDAALLAELEAMEQTYHAQEQARPEEGDQGAGLEELSLMGILRSDVHRRLLLACCLASAFPAMSGQEAFLSFATQSFQMVGFDVKNGADFAVGLYSMKLVATLPDFLWLDAFGRRKLLAAGTSMIGVSYAVAAVATHFKQPGVAGAALLGAALAYQVGVAPVTWIISSELSPSDMRTRGCALAAAVYSSTSLLSVQFFPLLLRAGGPLAPLATYAGSTVLAVLLIRKFIPETQGQALEQIEADAISGRLFRRCSMDIFASSLRASSSRPRPAEAPSTETQSDPFLVRTATSSASRPPATLGAPPRAGAPEQEEPGLPLEPAPAA